MAMRLHGPRSLRRAAFTSGRPCTLQSVHSAVAGRGAQTACHASISFPTHGTDGTYNLAVEVCLSEDVVGSRVCDIVEAAAQEAVSRQGKFFLAIPGGSVLKMCGGLEGRQIDWANTYLFYANHKCVPNDDKSSTHKKALDIFITKVGLPLANVSALTGSADGPAEAAAYAAHLRDVAEKYGMDMTAGGVPRFDVMLLGMGADGHVGSLYPGRNEVNMTGELVLAVAKKEPASITLSLPVMRAARHCVIAATGASKAPAIRTALETKVAPQQLPGAAVRPHAGASLTWLLDAAGASDLGSKTAATAMAL